MKKLLLLISFLIVIGAAKAQVVFCPPGAEWHYLFNETIFWPGNTYNARISYVGDSISGTDTLKVLSHQMSSLYCGKPISYTLIKQKGDTVFFRNKLTIGWQVLYNFAAQSGQTWQTTLYGKAFTTTVQAVGTVTVNGLGLRTMTVSTDYGDYDYAIIERIGANGFLFNYVVNRPNQCDDSIFMEFLCYKDNSFGTKQFGDKSCYYYTSNSVGIKENEATDNFVKFFPNPTKDFITIEYYDLENAECIFTDISGREIKKINLDQTSKISVQDLAVGIYLLTITKGSEKVYTTKFIKQ